MAVIQSIGLPPAHANTPGWKLLQAMFTLDLSKRRYNEFHVNHQSDSAFMEHALASKIVDDRKELFRREATTLLLNFLVASRTLRLLLDELSKHVSPHEATRDFREKIGQYDSVDGYRFIKFLRDHMIHQQPPVFQAVEYADVARSIGLALEGYELNGGRFTGAAKRYVRSLLEGGQLIVDINSLVVTSGHDLYVASHSLHLASIEAIRNSEASANNPTV